MISLKDLLANSELIALIGTILAFLLHKYFENKPKLVTYYGHVFAHQYQPDNLRMRLFNSSKRPEKKELDSAYYTLPIIIKFNDEIWFYVKPPGEETRMIRSMNPNIYNTLHFPDQKDVLSDEMPIGNEIILKDLHLSSAHPTIFDIFTHEIVIRNDGKLSAKNVRVGHNIFPTNYRIVPPVPHVRSNKDRELRFDILVPGEQVTISYLYFPPTSYDQVSTYVKSDEGFATRIAVMPTKVYSKSTNYFLLFLILIGSWWVIYFAIRLILCVYTGCFI